MKEGNYVINHHMQFEFFANNAAKTNRHNECRSLADLDRDHISKQQTLDIIDLTYPPNVLKFVHDVSGCRPIEEDKYRLIKQVPHSFELIGVDTFLFFYFFL